MRNRLAIFFLAGIVVLSGAQCAVGTGAGGQGGIHRSDDQGAVWVPKNLISTEAGQGSLSRLNILDIEIDPSDNNRLFAATQQAGLYKSEDSGDTWSPVTTSGQIQSIDINPGNSNKLVAARSNQIFFSADGGEIWSLVYTNPASQLIMDVVFDYFNPNRLYAAVATGELLVSTDEGKTWSLLKRFNHAIEKVFVHPQLEDRIYVFSRSRGIDRTDDMGENWYSITDGINSKVLPLKFIDFDVHPRSVDSLLVASNKDMFMSSDGGKTWSTLDLLAEAAQQMVSSIAWDPQSRSRIFYVTPTVFNVSSDFGKSWATTPFISRNRPSKLLVHPENSDILYIGTVAE